MSHEIFKLIPHQRVVTRKAENEAMFDLYQFGTFNNHLITENIELIELQRQVEYSPHYHEKSSVVLYIIAGMGRIQLEKNFLEYKPGMRIDIPMGMLHGFKTMTRTLVLSIHTPPLERNKKGKLDIHYEQTDEDWSIAKEWGAFIKIA